MKTSHRAFLEASFKVSVAETSQGIYSQRFLEAKTQIGALFNFLYGKEDPRPEDLAPFEALFSVVPEGEYRDPKRKFAFERKSDLGFGHTVDFHGIIELCEKLVEKNRAGWHAYHSFKRSDVIVFDDLPREDLEAMESDDIVPNVLIKTSPSNFQGIITIPHDLIGCGFERDFDRLKTLKAGLSRKFGTDATIIDWNRQVLRLPGFFNVSEKHFFQGGFPLARMERCNASLLSPGLARFLF